jgi:hypothetical protein
MTSISWLDYGKAFHYNKIEYCKDEIMISVSPQKGSIGNIPFLVNFISTKPGTLYLKEGNKPFIGDPETDILTLPVSLNITEIGMFKFWYFAVFNDATQSDMDYVFYSVGQDFKFNSVTPNVGYANGSDTLIIKGQSFSYNTQVYINSIKIPSILGEDSNIIIARTLVNSPGYYDIEVKDGVNLKIIKNGFYVIENPILIQDDDVIESGETREDLFDTEKGPFLLRRKSIEDYDIDYYAYFKTVDKANNLKIVHDLGEIPQPYKVI